MITDWILLKLNDLKIRENSNFKVWFLFLIALYQHDTKKINQAYIVTDYLNNPYLKKNSISFSQFT